jgi:hypothetical protein
MEQSKVEQFYENLPSDSKGWDAENQKRVKSFFEVFGSVGEDWPYLILCEEEDGALTWHMGCGDINERSWIDGE